MSDTHLQEYEDKSGSRRRVIHVGGALASWFDAAGHLTPEKADIAEGFFVAFMENWLNNPSVARSRGTPEGELPNGKKFFAIRHGDIRAYFWHSKKHRNTIMISHYVYKKWNRLKKNDTQKVCGNWRKTEMGD